MYVSLMGGGGEGQKKESTFGKNETINVFSIASGHLYERFLRYIRNIYIPLLTITFLSPYHYEIDVSKISRRR